MKNPILSSCKKILSLILTTILLLSTLSGQVLAVDPKISIIIPVYNVSEKLLRDCLESAKNQTLKDIEIICVDDGSTNGSGKILDEYAKNDPRFNVVHQKNGGTCVARNKGMELAKGEYIQFLDHDDTIDPKMSEKCYNEAKEHDADMVLCTHVNPKKIGFFFNMACWNGIYKTKFLNDNNITFKGLVAHGEDFAFNFMAYINKAKIVYLNEILHKYILNTNSQTVTTPYREIIMRYKNNLHAIYEYCKNNQYFNNNDNKIIFLQFLLSMTSKVNKVHHKLFIDSIGPELLQDDAVNLLPYKERQQLKNIIQAAKSCD